MKLHLAYLFATKHYIGSALGLHSSSRRLTLDQAEAAKRVDNAVNVALSSVENGDVTGVALPLNYVALSSKNGYEQQLTVNLGLPGVDRNLNILIDTGSSSLAFCNKSLAEEASISKVDYAQCNQYGENSPTCPDNSTGSSLFFVGQVYEGNVGAYNNQGEEIASMDNVTFTIMDEKQIYTCDSPLDGILGISHSVGNMVVSTPTLDFDASSLWSEYCKKPDLGIGFESIGSCALGNLSQVTLPSPLEAALSQGVESGYNKAEAFGLYLDYAATIGSTEDTIVPSLGAYFGGDLALNNDFYNGGNVQTSKQVTNNCQGITDPLEWYQLAFNTIRVPSLNFTYDTTELCQVCSNCYTDSGNSMIQLPLPEEYCSSLPTNPDELKALGSLYIDLDGADGGNVTLELPLLWVKEQSALLGHVECTGLSGNFVLGLPISQYYYLAFEMANKTVTFVNLTLSDETENFIDGPELGGAASTSAGYLLYQAFTTGILVAASCIYLVQ